MPRGGACRKHKLARLCSCTAICQCSPDSCPPTCVRTYLQNHHLKRILFAKERKNGHQDSFGTQLQMGHSDPRVEQHCSITIDQDGDSDQHVQMCQLRERERTCFWPLNELVGQMGFDLRIGVGGLGQDSPTCPLNWKVPENLEFPHTSFTFVWCKGRIY